MILQSATGHISGQNYHLKIYSAHFSSTYTKIGMIQRRLAWPLCKDDMQIHEAFHIFVKQITSPGWMHETSAQG